MRACQSAEKKNREISFSPVVSLPVGLKETVLVVAAKQFVVNKINAASSALY